jgi:hypothetical protein
VKYSTLIGIALLVALIAACDAAQINRICEPVLNREFNVVYNAHFRGELSFNNSCGDTARVFYTDADPVTVLPGAFYSLSLNQGQQYLVNVQCADSTLTYTYTNQCP